MRLGAGLLVLAAAWCDLVLGAGVLVLGATWCLVLGAAWCLVWEKESGGQMVNSAQECISRLFSDQEECSTGECSHLQNVQQVIPRCKQCSMNIVHEQQ